MNQFDDFEAILHVTYQPWFWKQTWNTLAKIYRTLLLWPAMDFKVIFTVECWCQSQRGLYRAKHRVPAPLATAGYGKKGTARALPLFVSTPHHPQQQTRSAVAVSISALKTSLDGGSAALLSNDFQYCTTLPGKKFLLQYHLNRRFFFLLLNNWKYLQKMWSQHRVSVTSFKFCCWFFFFPPG